MSITYYPRPEVLAHPGFRKGHVVIEASAGTGKTFTLEHLVLDLIIDNRANIEQILVVTFTDAATRELRERVRSLIRKVCDEGAEVKPGKEIDLYWEVNDVTRARLQEALFRFDGAAISTIHGFCQRILSEQAFLGGRLFKQEHMDGQEIFGLAFREEVRLALAESGPVSDALRMWIEQENSLHRLQNLLYSCHREGCPDRCPVTPVWDPQGFWEAVNNLPEKEDLQNDIQAFFTDNNLRIGYGNLIKRLFDTVTAIAIEPGSNLQEAVPLFLKWANKTCTINRVSDTQINHLYRAAGVKGAPDTIKILAGGVAKMALRAASESSFFVYSLLPRVQKRLNARKLSLGLIDYDDMLLGVREALTGENASVLLDVLRRRWKYALVDEFQDTDPVQWEIFRRIFVDGKGDHHLLVIGDPKQAIYGFRGADVYTYEVAKNHLVKKCGASRLPLKKNYRSTRELIAAVNAILTTTGHSGKGFFCGLNRYDEPVECGDLSRSAFEGGKPAVPVHLIHLYGEGEDLTAGSIRRGLACFIAEEICRLTCPENGLATGRGGGEPVPVKLNDIYILTRTGQEGRQIGEVLRRYGIPHAFYKMEGLFSTAEAEDIYSLLTAIESPQDPAARMLAWLTPFFGVPLNELMDWQGVSDHHPLMARLLRWKRLAGAREWARLFDDILAASGLIRRLIFLEGERELTNYLHLFELLLAEVHARPVTLPELARGLKARIDGRKIPAGREGDMQRLETDKDAVQILTMHKAKGLEAEVIFVGGGFGNPPIDALTTQIYHQGNRRCLHIGRATGEIAAAIEEENRQENQRLAYVALTRARSRLYLPYFGAAPGDNLKGRSYGNRLGKFYQALQTQLDLLRHQDLLSDQRLFVLREASCAVRPRREQATETSQKDWPGEHLLKPLPSSAEEAGRIKPGRRGILLTSYTRMKQGGGWQPPATGEDGQADWRSEEVEGEAGDTLPAGPALQTETCPESTPELPGGREAGIFLHALLEETSSADIAARTFEEWSTLPAVQKQAAACARRHGFPEEYLPGALQMVYHAFRTPLKVQDREHTQVLEMPGGIASGKHLQAEMSFVYPIPENYHPLLEGERATVSADAGDLPYKARRGYIRGLIDLVFEHKGKIYLLDWKSDSLFSFDEGSLNVHIEANYSLQAQVYLLAVVRLLGIKSEEEYESLFGGVLYLFIRGIRPGGAADRYTQGVWFSRPRWSRVISGEQELVNRREWGGEVIALDKVTGGSE